jgi:uncharacterized membrane protein
VANLFVWGFDTESGAADALPELERLQEEHLLTLEDAAVGVRREDGKVKVRQAVDLVGAGALGGTSWGMLIGVLFLAPWLGASSGPAGPTAGTMQRYGIDDEFIERVGGQIELGHSAVFMLVRAGAADKVVERLRALGGEIVHASLSKEDEDRLKGAFGAED